MSLPIHVDAYSGYKANEHPRQFTLDEEIYEVDAVLDHWYEPSATYFKVQSSEGKTYLLRYDEEAVEWTLQRNSASSPRARKRYAPSPSLVLACRNSDGEFAYEGER